MKLKKYIKNKKQKKIIIGSIIVFLLLVGGITLYKTFALYEEKKEFSALKGRVPNFIVDAPTLTLGKVTSDDISITIPYTITGTEPIKITCVAGLEEGNYSIEGVIENNQCKLNNLQTNKTYYYKIEANNKTQIPAIETGSIKTSVPTVSITGASSTTSSASFNFTTTGHITSKSCKCGSKGGSISGNTCNVSGLSGATTYSCSVTVTNSNGYSVSTSRNITTATPKATYNGDVCNWFGYEGTVSTWFYNGNTYDSDCQNYCTAKYYYYCAHLISNSAYRCTCAHLRNP